MKKPSVGSKRVNSRRLSLSFSGLAMAFVFAAGMLALSCAQDNILESNGDTISIDSIFPSQGIIGTQVRLYGKGFSIVPKENVVTIGGVAAPVLDPASLGALLIKIPEGTKTGNVKLAINRRDVTGPVFTLVDPPVFTDIKPGSGYEGTLVTLFGSRFRQVQRVLFNGVPAAITQREDDRLVVTAPASTTGMIVLDYGAGQLQTVVFTYLPVPLIRSVIDGGKGLQLAASNISPTANALRVYYNGASASILNVTDVSGSNANVLAAFPSEDSPNPFEIVLSSNGIRSLPFTYTIKPEVERVTYSVVSSTQTTITYDITLYGRYFDTTADGNKAVITFLTRLPSDVANEIQSWSATKVVTRITVSTAWSIGGGGAFREYYGSVSVNGVESDKVKM
jgi:hypothetical protein